MALTFTDLNFKLVVVNELMYNQSVLGPAFDLAAFLAGRGLAEPEYGEVCAEALAYVEQLDVPEDLAATITSLYQDGGDEIYLQLCPGWDGEDDTFDVRSVADAAQLPALEEVTLIHTGDESLLEELRGRGIEADWL